MDQLEKIELIEQQSETVPCIACRVAIPKSATVCSSCKSYQARWKNRLQYLAGITALIVALFTWTVPTLPTIRKVLFWRDEVRVIALNSRASTVVANYGDGEVFISHILVYVLHQPNWIAPRVPIETIVPAGQFLRHTVSNQKKLFDDGHFLRSLTDQEQKASLDKTLAGDSCYELTFLHQDDPFLTELRGMAGPRLMTVQAGGYLKYFSAHDRQMKTLDIPVVGVIRQNNQAPCK